MKIKINIWIKYLLFLLLFFLLCISAIGSLLIIYKERNSVVNYFKTEIRSRTNFSDVYNPIIKESKVSNLNNYRIEENLSGDENLLGFWTPAFDWPLIAIHANLLPDGKVFTFGSLAGKSKSSENELINKKITLSDNTTVERDIGDKQFKKHNLLWGSDFDIWTPSLGYASNSHEIFVDPIKVNSFCSIVRVIDDSHLFMLGGDEKPIRGIKDSGPDTQKATVLFDLKNKKFKYMNNLNYPRWYGSVVRLKDDNMLILGGNDNANLTASGSDEERASIVPEILLKNKNQNYDWKILENIKSDFFFGTKNLAWIYPKAFLTSQNRVFGISYNNLFLISNMNNNGVNASIKKVGEIPLVNNAYKKKLTDNNANNKKSDSLLVGSIGSAVSQHATAVMARKNNIIILGGLEIGHFASNHVYSILIDNPEKPVIKRLSNMNFPRFDQNATLLPTGDIFVNGGSSFDVPEDHNSFSVLVPEIYKFELNKWFSLKQTNFKRNYHSISLLLPDGTILVAGGDVLNAQIYYPPYLFKKNRDGKTVLADRPNLKLLKNQILNNVNLNFEAYVDDISSIKSISLISAGAVTHSQPSESKFYELNYEVIDNKKDQKKINIKLDNADDLANGLYLVFLVNGLGVPSIGQTLLIKNNS